MPRHASHTPVTDHSPFRKSGVWADEGGVVRIAAPQESVRAHITLLLPGGKVPEWDSKVFIPCQFLKNGERK